MAVGMPRTVAQSGGVVRPGEVRESERTAVVDLPARMNQHICDTIRFSDRIAGSRRRVQLAAPGLLIVDVESASPR
jgi:hypothetical protein